MGLNQAILLTRLFPTCAQAHSDHLQLVLLWIGKNSQKKVRDATCGNCALKLWDKLPAPFLKES